MSTAVADLTNIDTRASLVTCASCSHKVAVHDVLALWLEIDAARDLCPRCSGALFR